MNEINHAGYYMLKTIDEKTYHHIDRLTAGSIWRVMDQSPSYVVYLSCDDSADEIGAIYINSIIIGEGVLCTTRPSRSLSITNYTFSMPVNVTVRGKTLIVSETLED